MKVIFEVVSGETWTVEGPRGELIERLEMLDALERETRKYDPTDNGLTRLNAIREASAIRKAVFNLLDHRKNRGVFPRAQNPKIARRQEF